MPGRYRILALALVSLLTYSFAYGEPRSFEEVERRVFGTPLALPERKPISDLGVVNALLYLGNAGVNTDIDTAGFPPLMPPPGPALHPTVADVFDLHQPISNSFIDRIRRTLFTQDGPGEDDDFKASANKKIHTMGVCTTARWSIDESKAAHQLGYTGLFAAGTNVEAILRFSVSLAKVRYQPGVERAFGLGVKLFPASSSDQPVISRDVLFFDRYGLDGSDRPFALTSDPGDGIYFINQVHGKSLQARVISFLFGLFDPNPGYRPLEPLADIDRRGATVVQPKAPSYLILKPIGLIHRDLSPDGLDFRDEIRAYSAGTEFDILLSDSPSNELIDPETFALRSTQTVSVGRLIFDRTPSVTDVCDRELHFRHYPNHE